MADIFRVTASYEPWMAKITYNQTSPKTWRRVEQSPTTWRTVQILKSPKNMENSSRTIPNNLKNSANVKIFKNMENSRTIPNNIKNSSKIKISRNMENSRIIPNNMENM
jgi:hypothetical protein